MTRETKIGLLVGLAFIVVFAVLLSHTGTVPPPGEAPPTVIAGTVKPTTVLDLGGRGDIAQPEPPPAVATPTTPATPETPPTGVQPQPPEAIVSGSTFEGDLPNPRTLEPDRSTFADAGHPREPAAEPVSSIFAVGRSMPPIQPADPQPSERPFELTMSALPPESATGPEMMMVAGTGGAPGTTPRTVTAQEYVVQGGGQPRQDRGQVLQVA